MHIINQDPQASYNVDSDRNIFFSDQVYRKMTLNIDPGVKRLKIMLYNIWLPKLEGLVVSDNVFKIFLNMAV